MLDHPFGEEFCPNIQSQFFLVQLEAISACPITCYMEEDTDPPYYNLLSQRCRREKRSPPEPPSRLNILHKTCKQFMNTAFTNSQFWCFAEDTSELSKGRRHILLFLHFFRRYLLYNRYIKGPYVSTPTAFHTSASPACKEGTNSHLLGTSNRSLLCFSHKAPS